ncbi:ATP-dependent 6-phosphofructokinase [Burkholderiaceae bacterium DAT-1]|nr:ATP-dependent 6-phosphofructokinase [Burkholderiaceae bacterium DAT-1]
MATPIKRIAISTGGGDAPGLNAVIRAVVTAAAQQGWECYGIRDGFGGIFFPERYADGGLIRLRPEQVANLTHVGGTVIGTSNRGNPFAFPVTRPDGSVHEVDRSDEVIDFFAAHQLDALVAVGGDGTLTIADQLYKKGLRVIGVPKTIDNDLDKTYTTFGFDTAVSFATESIDRLHSTAQSHQRIMVVEVMGRYAGWIALHAGLAANAHAILLPEMPFDINTLATFLRERESRDQQYAIVVVAEGATPVGGGHALLPDQEAGHAERLGGMGEQVAQALGKLTGKDVRTVVLGHLLRGGSPSAFDRLAALRFGAAAVRALAQGQNGVMVALAFPNVNYVPLDEVAGRMKSVPLDGDTLATARALGVCLGD